MFRLFSFQGTTSLFAFWELGFEVPSLCRLWYLSSGVFGKSTVFEKNFFCLFLNSVRRLEKGFQIALAGN
jgi:hypothetical protein